MGVRQLINKHYNDCYFSSDSGYLESEYVFIDGNNLKERSLNNIFIGETGFGTGLNLLVLEDYLVKNKHRNINLTYTTVEKYPLPFEVVKGAISQLDEVSPNSFLNHKRLYQTISSSLVKGWNNYNVKRDWGTLNFNIFYGDIMDSFYQYPTQNNCWFLDGHSPDKNPDMWKQDVFNNVAKYTSQNGTFATFTSAGIVKRGLRESGFTVKRKKGFGKKRHMIFGILKT